MFWLIPNVWVNGIKMSCEMCGEIENVKHLLYDCKDSSFINKL